MSQNLAIWIGIGHRGDLLAGRAHAVRADPTPGSTTGKSLTAGSISNQDWLPAASFSDFACVAYTVGMGFAISGTQPYVRPDAPNGPGSAGLLSFDVRLGDRGASVVDVLRFVMAAHRSCCAVDPRRARRPTANTGRWRASAGWTRTRCVASG